MSEENKVCLQRIYIHQTCINCWCSINSQHVPVCRAELSHCICVITTETKSFCNRCLVANYNEQVIQEQIARQRQFELYEEQERSERTEKWNRRGEP